MSHIEIPSQQRGRIEFRKITDSLERNHDTHGFFVIAGPCAVDAVGTFGESDTVPHILSEEAAQLHELSEEFGMTIFHRQPVWKPRSNIQSWRGLIQTNPSAAVNLLHRSSRGQVPLALELGSVQHQRLLDFASIAWVGARSIGNTALHDMIIGNATIPMLVKNGVDEDMDSAFKLSTHLSRQRNTLLGGGASVSLIHRAGASKTPQEWEHSILVTDEMHRSHARITREPNHGFVIDASHGGELAHRPSHKKEKTIAGQQRAAEHTLELIEKNSVKSVIGIMLETSDIVLPNHKKTDPNLPFAEGIEIIRALGHIHKRRTAQQHQKVRSDWCHI